jgi:hypothetical protein
MTLEMVLAVLGVAVLVPILGIPISKAAWWCTMRLADRRRP